MVNDPPPALALADPPRDDVESEPDWLRPAVADTVAWLTHAFDAVATRNAYATHLGVPRAYQTWRGEPSGNRGRRSSGVLQQAFLRWALETGIDPLRELDHPLLRAWIAHARDCGDADTTLRSRLGAVLSWYREMRTRGRTTLNPGDWMSKQERKNLHVGNTAPAKPTVPLTTQQVRALLTAAAMDPTVHRDRNRAIVAILATTGLRARELCALNTDDVHSAGPDGTNPALRVHGKGNTYAWVRLGRAELDLLDEYLPKRISPTTGREITHLGHVSNRAEPLLTTDGGNRFTTGAITALLRRLCRLLDESSTSQVVRSAARELSPIAGTIHPHQFRHYYAQAAERNGYAATQVRKDLRHSSLTSTQTYLDAGNDLSASAAGFVSDLVHAGEDLTLLPTVSTTSEATS